MAENDVREQRVHRFGSFFKHYMGASTLVTAALPIPIAELKLIPVYDAQRHFLGVYTSLFAFLIFAWCFYERHMYGRFMLRMEKESPQFVSVRYIACWVIMNLVPLITIVLSILSVWEYHAMLDLSLESSSHFFKEPLKEAPLGSIPHSAALMMSYLGIFLLAEVAFVSMAVKEYLLDLLKIGDERLIRPSVERPQRQAHR